jgi:hypothetical protein
VPQNSRVQAERSLAKKDYAVPRNSRNSTENPAAPESDLAVCPEIEDVKRLANPPAHVAAKLGVGLILVLGIVRIVLSLKQLASLAVGLGISEFWANILVCLFICFALAGTTFGWTELAFFVENKWRELQKSWGTGGEKF